MNDERINTMPLTTKELFALEDRLNGEQLVIKKYRIAAQSCTDSVIKSQFDRIASLHQNHYNKLLNFLR
jgi:rubrerythrin